MSLRDSDHNRLFRRVEVNIIFAPDTKMQKVRRHQTAGPHQGFGPDGIDDLLMQTADQLEQLYPWWEFKMVPLAPSGRVAKYNFIHIGFNASFSLPEGTLPEIGELPAIKETPDDEGSTAEPSPAAASSAGEGPLQPAS